MSPFCSIQSTGSQCTETLNDVTSCIQTRVGEEVGTIGKKGIVYLFLVLHNNVSLLASLVTPMTGILGTLPAAFIAVTIIV